MPFKDPGHPTMKMCMIPINIFFFSCPWIFVSAYNPCLSFTGFYAY